MKGAPAPVLHWPKLFEGEVCSPSSYCDGYANGEGYGFGWGNYYGGGKGWGYGDTRGGSWLRLGYGKGFGPNGYNCGGGGN